MDGPFIGAEAMAAGSLTRHRLRTNYQALFPGVYLSTTQTPTLAARTVAAWLWSKRQGVIAGAAAAALHGARWIDDDVPIEIICPNTHPPRGLLTRNDSLRDGDVVWRRAMPVTSLLRTGFDLGRRGPQVKAVARLDALCRATGLHAEAIGELADQRPRARGLCQLRRVLDLVDAGAESPKETWLRLLLVNAGLPRPATQITVVDRGWTARLDMGWEDLKVAVEYDGDHHRVDRRQYLKDIRRLERLHQLGWIVIRVVSEDHPDDVLRRVLAALATRARKPH